MPEEKPPIDLMPVTIMTDRPVEIYEQPEDGAERRVLSTANASYDGPYAVGWLHKHGEFRVSGPGITSATFQLPEDGEVKLQITTGSRSRSNIGAALWISGGIIAAGGLWILLGGALTNGPEASAVGPPGWIPLSKQLYISGGVLLSAGVIGFVVGLGYYAAAKTRVQISPTSATAAIRLPAGVLLSARGLEF